jgi:hypothetical protein
MPSWLTRVLQAVSLAPELVFRVYGVVFLALAGLFIYWAGRGLLAYSQGVREAWTDPGACIIGLIAAGLSFWAGSRMVSKSLPSRGFGRLGGMNQDLQNTFEQALKLEKTDPAASQQLLDDYFMREASTTEARRAELRQRATHDRQAAIALRRELKEDLATNAMMRKDVANELATEEVTSLLAQLDADDRTLQSEVLKLEHIIALLKAH